MSQLPVSDQQIAFEIVTDTAGFEALREDWQRLWQDSAGEFYVLSFPVLWRTWIQVFEPRGDRLSIVVGRQTGRVVLIWPQLIKSRRYYGIWREARWFGREPIDHGDVLVESSPERDAWVEAALNYLLVTAQVDFHFFESVRNDAIAFPALERACNWKEPDDPAPFANLENIASGAELEKWMPKRFRGSMNRRLRRLKEVGPVTFELEPEPDGLAELIRWMNARKWEWIDDRGVVKAHGLADEHGTSLIDIIRDGAKTGHTLVGRLSVNGELIAASISFLAGKRLYYDYGSFDLRWAKYSPGSQLLRETIRWAVNNGYEIFDFAPGADHYKIKWSDSEIEITDYLIARTLPGKLFVVVRGSKTVRNWIAWMKALLKRRGPAYQQD